MLHKNQLEDSLVQIERRFSLSKQRQEQYIFPRKRYSTISSQTDQSLNKELYHLQQQNNKPSASHQYQKRKQKTEGQHDENQKPRKICTILNLKKIKQMTIKKSMIENNNQYQRIKRTIVGAEISHKESKLQRVFEKRNVYRNKQKINVSLSNKKQSNEGKFPSSNSEDISQRKVRKNEGNCQQILSCLRIADQIVPKKVKLKVFSSKKIKTIQQMKNP